QGINEKRFHLHVGGNAASLYPALLRPDDYPGAFVAGEWIGLANVTGNSMSSGGHGVRWRDNCTNAIVLKNGFASPTLRALSYDGTNGAVRNVAVLKNQLGQGNSYHLKVRPQEAGAFFLWQN